MRRGTSVRVMTLLLLSLGGMALVSQGAHAQAAGTIRITGPAAGATVSGPVMLQVQITGVTVKPAAEGDPQAYHYHALVDIDPAAVVQPGQPLPTGEANIIHTAAPSLELPDLAPGAHSVTVILTRTDHVPLQPLVQDRVSFTVAAAGQAAPGQAAPAQSAAAAPRVGQGGAVLADNQPSLILLLTLAALVFLSGSGALLWVRGRR